MILLDHAPYTPFDTLRTARPPGLSPLDMNEWTVVHDDFAAQMAYREKLLQQEAETVLNCRAGAEPAVAELLEMLLGHLSRHPGYQVTSGSVRRPDGVEVALSANNSMATLALMGRLIAEDLCLMQRSDLDEEYKLNAAVLCFPSRWLLSEKIGRPLTAIHEPVPDYDETLARRVNRVFEALSPDRPLVRCNWLVHGDPELFRPLGREGEDASRSEPVEDLYLRTERQTLVRLPQTGAVVFGIKTSVTPLEKLTDDAMQALLKELSELSLETLEYSERGDVFCKALDQLRSRLKQ